MTRNNWTTKNTGGLKRYYQTCLEEARREGDARKIREYESLLKSMEPKKSKEE